MGDHRLPATQFQRDGHKVEVAEDAQGVHLKIDNHPIEVEVVDGGYSSHLAHMFVIYDDLYALIDQLFATEGKTWRLEHTHAPHPHPAGNHEGGQER